MAAVALEAGGDAAAKAAAVAAVATVAAVVAVPAVGKAPATAEPLARP